MWSGSVSKKFFNPCRVFHFFFILFSRKDRSEEGSQVASRKALHCFVFPGYTLLLYEEWGSVGLFLSCVRESGNLVNPFLSLTALFLKKKKKFMWTRRSNVGGCTYVQLKFSFYIQNNMLLFVEFLLLVASDVQKDAKLDDSVV